MQDIPVQVAVFLGLSTLAAVVYFALIRAGSGLKGTQQKHKNAANKKNTIVTFFTDPNAVKEAGAKSTPAAGSSHLDFKKMILISKYNETHDTIVLRFALPHHGKCCANGSDKSPFSAATFGNILETAGIAPSKHVQIRASINGEMVQRSFSPTSCAVDEAHCGLMDLHVKVYHPDPSKGLSGGVMSCYLNGLAIGSDIEIRGPTGLVEYAGNGAFLVGTGAPKPRRVVAGKHLVLIAGGSGITPIVATLKAILHGKLGGMKVPANAANVDMPLSPTTGAALCKEVEEGTSAEAKPLARREYLRGECRHSFYEPSPTCLDESSNAIERITFIYCNHTIGDIMFKDWLVGADAEHSCYGAFAALAEVGQVAPEDEGTAAKLADGFRAKSIDVSMNYFVTRPTAADTKAMAAANKLWAKEEEALWGLPPAAAKGARSRSNSKTASPSSPASSSVDDVKNATKTSAVVTRRYVAGRPTEDSVKACMAHGGDALTTSAIRAKFAAEMAEIVGGEGSSNTVALLCGPNGLLNDVARPALLAAGVPKDRILLA